MHYALFSSLSTDPGNALAMVGYPLSLFQECSARLMHWERSWLRSLKLHYIEHPDFAASSICSVANTYYERSEGPFLCQTQHFASLES